MFGKQVLKSLEPTPQVTFFAWENVYSFFFAGFAGLYADLKVSMAKHIIWRRVLLPHAAELSTIMEDLSDPTPVTVTLQKHLPVVLVIVSSLRLPVLIRKQEMTF